MVQADVAITMNGVGQPLTMRYWLKLAFVMTTIFALFIVVIRVLPDDDRATSLLTHENCPSSCFLGIHPGETTMREAVYYLDGHPWVATRAESLPSLVQQAVFYDAAIPRISIQWQWSVAIPEWVNATQPGRLTLENREVREMAIDTNLSLGEIMLALGEPDDARFSASTTQIGHFEYSAWYAAEEMLVRGEGVCPIWHYYKLPVQIHLRPDKPKLPQLVAKAFVCG
jgi:hypothetical protein